MALTSWIILAWGLCAGGMVILDRVMAARGTGILDTKRPVWSTALIYVLVLLLSPILLPIAIVLNAKNIWGWIISLTYWWRGLAPELAHHAEWPTDYDGLLWMLVRRRQRFDTRLKQERLGKWFMRQFWETPDAVLFEVIDAYQDLKHGGAEDWAIWERLDSWLEADGSPVPPDATVLTYLKSRARFIDPMFLKFGDRFLSGHTDICLRWLDKTKPMKREAWPPREWLTRQLTFAEFEALCVTTGEWSAKARAVPGMSRYRREVERLKLRMLTGDELWSFSTPPGTWRKLTGRAGVALVRKGCTVAYVVTAMN